MMILYGMTTILRSILIVLMTIYIVIIDRTLTILMIYMIITIYMTTILLTILITLMVLTITPRTLMTITLSHHLPHSLPLPRPPPRTPRQTHAGTPPASAAPKTPATSHAPAIPTSHSRSPNAVRVAAATFPAISANASSSRHNAVSPAPLFASSSATTHVSSSDTSPRNDIHSPRELRITVFSRHHSVVPSTNANVRGESNSRSSDQNSRRNADETPFFPAEIAPATSSSFSDNAGVSRGRRKRRR